MTRPADSAPPFKPPLIERLRRQARHLFYSSPLYRLSLKGSVPTAPARALPDPWPGKADLGTAIVGGVFPLVGGAVELSGDPWRHGELGMRRRAELDGFGWLRHLRALNNDAGQRRARELVGLWLDAHPHWDGFSWRNDILGARLIHWLTNYGFICGRGDDVLAARLMASITAQLRHLTRRIGKPGLDGGRFTAVRGLIAGGLTLPGFERLLPTGLNRLDEVITEQILPDGGHIQRSPSIHLAVLEGLLELKAQLTAVQVEVPMALQTAIDRMAPFLKTLRHGDHRLALFHGGGEEEEERITRALTLSETRAKAMASAPHSGYQRLQAAKTVVLADVGEPPPSGADGVAHSGLFSFEMSIGRHRLVVNCGAHPDDASSWHGPLRATAAHSTMTVGDVNAVPIRGDGGLDGRRLDIAVTRRETEGNVLLELSHGGYRERFGTQYSRDLYLSPDGDDLRGRDALSPAHTPTSFALRFHLHPEVQASLVQGGSVLLRLHNGDGWRFRATGGTIELLDSVYLGGGTARRAQQIVVGGPLGEDGAAVKWAFRREGKREP